ncbi:MAG: ubiquinol-cytochrome c reductase iron-sulfur subunit [Acidobacteriota bacterium]
MTTSPKAGRSRLEPEPITRRDFLGMGAMGAAVLALGVTTLGMMRLPKAAVLSSPSKKYRVTLPESLAPGLAFLPPGRSVAVFRDAEGVYAISLICTHLGCIVKSQADGFDCPCHGSRFALDGSVKKGPAPRALAWYQVTGGDGNYIVDEGTTVPAGTRLKV